MKSVSGALCHGADLVRRYKLSREEIVVVSVGAYSSNLCIQLREQAFVRVALQSKVPRKRIELEFAQDTLHARFDRFGASWSCVVRISREQFAEMLGHDALAISEQSVRINGRSELLLAPEAPQPTEAV